MVVYYSSDGVDADVGILSWGRFLVLGGIFFPLPSSGDCSLMSGPMTWLMFATPVRGLELSEI